MCVFVSDLAERESATSEPVRMRDWSNNRPHVAGVEGRTETEI